MQTKQHNAELLHTQSKPESTNDTKENSSSEQLIERIPIDETPFTMVRSENKCFGTVGRYKVTEDYKTIPEVEEAILKFDWKILLKVLTIVIEEEVRLQLEARIERLKTTRQTDMRTAVVDEETNSGSLE